MQKKKGATTVAAIRAMQEQIKQQERREHEREEKERQEERKHTEKEKEKEDDTRRSRCVNISSWERLNM